MYFVCLQNSEYRTITHQKSRDDDIITFVICMEFLKWNQTDQSKT